MRPCGWRSSFYPFSVDHKSKCVLFFLCFHLVCFPGKENTPFTLCIDAQLNGKMFLFLECGRAASLRARFRILWIVSFEHFMTSFVRFFILLIYFCVACRHIKPPGCDISLVFSVFSLWRLHNDADEDDHVCRILCMHLNDWWIIQSRMVALSAHTRRQKLSLSLRRNAGSASRRTHSQITWNVFRFHFLLRRDVSIWNWIVAPNL